MKSWLLIVILWFASAVFLRASEPLAWQDLELPTDDPIAAKEELLTEAVYALEGRTVKLRGFIMPESVFSESPEHFVFIAEIEAGDEYGPTWQSLPLHLRIAVELDGFAAKFTTRPLEVEGRLEIVPVQDSLGTNLLVYNVRASKVCRVENRKGFVRALSRDKC